MTVRRGYVYRVFSSDAALLYIGTSMSPGALFSEWQRDRRADLRDRWTEDDDDEA